MNFFSQAMQDRFVWEVTNHKPIGSFLDIGAGGRSISNTLGLEEEGWRGWLIDNSPEAQKDSIGRNSQFILADATAMGWEFLPDAIDYLSLDVDYESFNVLNNLPLGRTRFGIITIEHDKWRFGDELRSPMRRMLIKEFDYDLVCADVSNPDPFEDWYVSPHLSHFADRFRSVGKTPQQIFA